MTTPDLDALNEAVRGEVVQPGDAAGDVMSAIRLATDAGGIVSKGGPTRRHSWRHSASADWGEMVYRER